MVASEGGAETENGREDEILVASDSAISARPMSQAMSVMSIRRKWYIMKREEYQKIHKTQKKIHRVRTKSITSLRSRDSGQCLDKIARTIIIIIIY